MGKARKLRVKAKTSCPNQNVPILSNKSILDHVDVESIKSFKTIKNKFGIQKQIKKSDKLKIKKNVLKKRIDLKELNKSTSNSNKLLTESLGTCAVKELLDKKVDEAIKMDPEEEYVKITTTKRNNNNKKGLQKKDKRRKQMIKDVNHLKYLMSSART